MVNQLRDSQPMDSPKPTDDNIDDESDADESVPPLRYDITSFGIDFDVEGLVRRLNDEEVFVPDWQRHFVWTIRQASSFIESLLLGLPVPGVFLGKDADSGRLYVIDGQQRLKTLQFFYSGKFEGSDTPNSAFHLKGVDDRFKDLAFKDLRDTDRRNLNNSLIHATVVRQDAPPDNDTSMYQIFKRLNTGGSQVNPQEIRCAIYQGDLIGEIKRLNQYPEWRGILGKPSSRLKDQELILRFMAMWHQGNQYTKPMLEFLNAFTQQNRNPDGFWLEETSTLFEQTISAFAEAKNKPFRLHEGRVVNAAVFDSMTVGLARRINNRGVPRSSQIATVHDSLIADDHYLQAVVQRTSDEGSVEQRLKTATIAFADA